MSERSEAAAAAGTSSAPPSSETEAAVTKLMMQKVDGGKKTALAMTAETFGMADGGNHKKGDKICESLNEAIIELTKMIEAAEKVSTKWNFSLTPFELLNATVDDMYRAFVVWSVKDDVQGYNVSKAFRRLDSYATWMEEHRSVLEEPLTKDSISGAVKAWNCKLSHTNNGVMVWWIDVLSMDTQAIKSGVTHDESLRYMVWLSHVVMFDKQAQDNGMILMQSLGQMGMIKLFTLVPMDLGTKMDRFTIGVVPLKMKGFYMMNNSRWLTVLIAMIKPFLSKKMRQRMHIVPRKDDPQVLLDELVGRESIPVGFAGLEGSLEQDLISLQQPM